MVLGERVGWPIGLCDPIRSIESLQESIARVERPQAIEMRRSSHVHQSWIIALEYYLLDDQRNAADWGRKLLDFGDDYFFGEWRSVVQSGNSRKEPPNREYYDVWATWGNELDACLSWGAVLGEWDRVRRFAEYLRDDVRTDIEQSPANRAWLLLVAGTLRKRSSGELQPFVDEIRSGKRTREKLLLDLLEAILQGNDEELAVASTAYFRYYKSSESRKAEIIAKLAGDGSFLFHFAEHLGRTVPIPSNVVDHVIRLKVT